MTHKQFRLNKLINPCNGCSLVTDSSKGLILGSLAGPEQFEDKTQRISKTRRISLLQG